MANPMYGQNKADNKVDSLIDFKNTWSFERPPIVMDDGVLGGAYAVPAGGDKTIHLHNYPAGDGSLHALQLCCWNQVAQDIDGPSVHANGMDYENENDDNDGVSWIMSYPGTKGIAKVDSFTVQSGYGFYAKLKFSIADVSVLDDCAFGFRLKSEAAETNFDDFSDVASLNVISGDINIESILNNAATTTTDTTLNWGDGEVHTLEVRISSAGVSSYYVDGAAVPTAETAVTYDAGDVLSPFMFFLHASAAACAVVLQELETGIL